jgi:hypothetical protein
VSLGHAVDAQIAAALAEAAVRARFMGKASVVRYWTGARWMELPDADDPLPGKR